MSYQSEAAMWISRPVAAVCTFLLLTGCIWNSPAPEAPHVYDQLAVVNSAGNACQVLGQVTARADCACHDKMSYDHVRGEASRNLEQQARMRYPDSDRIEISSVNLYLNNAVARGVAYKCSANI